MLRRSQHRVSAGTEAQGREGQTEEGSQAGLVPWNVKCAYVAYVRTMMHCFVRSDAIILQYNP